MALWPGHNYGHHLFFSKSCPDAGARKASFNGFIFFSLSSVKDCLDPVKWGRFHHLVTEMQRTKRLLKTKQNKTRNPRMSPLVVPNGSVFQAYIFLYVPEDGS